MDNEEKEHQDIVEGMLVRTWQASPQGIAVKIEKISWSPGSALPDTTRRTHVVHVLWPGFDDICQYYNDQLVPAEN